MWRHANDGTDPPFSDRGTAGRLLAGALRRYADRDGVRVLGLTRGGVPVAAEVARALGAPLDAMVVRKLGVPGQEELALGAIASGGGEVFNREVIAGLSLPRSAIDRIREREAGELARRERAYRGTAGPQDVVGRIVILVDDGLATGATMRAAARSVRAARAAEVVIAVPVAPADTVEALRSEADHVVCLATPEPFLGVGRWYLDFSQTTDAEVIDLLRRGGRGVVDRAG